MTAPQPVPPIPSPAGTGTPSGLFASIVIVAYRSRADLPRLFDCLDGQTDRDFETILIDNASPDDLGPDEAVQGRADVFIANPDNTGFARACNQGLQLARGRFTLFLNPDAFPEPGWIAALKGAEQRWPGVAAFGSLQLLDEDPAQADGVGDCMSAVGIAWRGGHRKPVPEPLEDAEVFSPCAAAAAWHTGWLRDRLGGFEESFGSYYEDVDLGFRHRLLGGRVIQLAGAVVRHRGSGSGSRYSDYAVFHGNRNRMWCHVACMPGPLFWTLLPLHVAATLLLWLHAIWRGAGPAYGRAMRAGVAGLRTAFERRHRLQASRLASSWQIARVLSWSPLALATRQPVRFALR